MKADADRTYHPSPVERDSWKVARKLLDVGVCVTAAILGSLAEDSRSFTTIALLIVVEVVYCMLVVRRNRLLLLVYFFIAYSCYSICFANYLHPLQGTVFTTLAGTSEALRALLILLLFSSAMVLFLPPTINAYGYGSDLFRCKWHNTLIVVVLLVALALIAFYGYARPDSLGGDRGKPTALYEYSTILFIVAFYFSGQSKALNISTFCLLALFAFQNIAYGGRVTALQLLLIAFYFVLNSKVTTPVLLIIFVSGFVLFVGFGEIRTSIWNKGIGSVFEAFMRKMADGLLWDTAYSAWYTSITFVSYSDMVSDETRLYLLGQWILSMFTGSNRVEDARLAILTKQYFVHYGGGVLPVYIWFYLGKVGVIVSAAYVSFLMHLTSKYCHPDRLEAGRVGVILRLCMLYVAITVPRWFLYSPSQITRGLLLCLLVISFLVWVDYSMKNRRRDVPVQHSSSGESVDSNGDGEQ